MVCSSVGFYFWGFVLLFLFVSTCCVWVFGCLVCFFLLLVLIFVLFVLLVTCWQFVSGLGVLWCLGFVLVCVLLLCVRFGGLSLLV